MLGLYSVKGGNRQVVERLAQRAQAVVQKNTHVISVDRKDSPRGEEYVLTSRHNDPGAVEVQQNFDAVIIAAPLEFANVTLAFLKKESIVSAPSSVNLEAKPPTNAPNSIDLPLSERKTN